MRLISGVILLVCAGCVFAQVDDPEVARAKAGMENVRALVEAGAAPRIQLQKAEEQIADAQDAALLRKTAYGQDLTVEQSDAMIAASARRLDRRQKAFDEAQKLVNAGVVSKLYLSTFLEELDSARKEFGLIESRAKLVAELAAMAKAEEALDTRLAEQPSEAAGAPDVAERFDGDADFTPSAFTKVEVAFAEHFGKPLPVSAMGDTAVHRALGFDHRGRVDVAVNPDQPEGVWLRGYLTEHRISYFAFRQAVPGKATGAHIHLGPMSTRLKLGG
ncbi:MAG TPA: hypothetical protein VE959_13665 [Bryobacteraceae bacterium]|nr:hypothetical protein [Bryobacteraceae bacterium]